MHSIGNSKVRGRTWPYGTKHRGEVVHNDWTERKKIHVQMVRDADRPGEAHILVGSGDASAAVGDWGTLEFCEGGPNGGYWKFTRDS